MEIQPVEQVYKGQIVGGQPHALVELPVLVRHGLAVGLVDPLNRNHQTFDTDPVEGCMTHSGHASSRSLQRDSRLAHIETIFRRAFRNRHAPLCTTDQSVLLHEATNATGVRLTPHHSPSQVSTKRKPGWNVPVKGQWELPGDGRELCPVVAMGSAQ